MTKKQMSILQSIEEGMNTSLRLACHLGIRRSIAQGFLTRLRKKGLLYVSDFNETSYSRFYGGKSEYVYDLTHEGLEVINTALFGA